MNKKWPFFIGHKLNNKHDTSEVLSNWTYNTYRLHQLFDLRSHITNELCAPTSKMPKYEYKTFLYA